MKSMHILVFSLTIFSCSIAMQKTPQSDASNNTTTESEEIDKKASPKIQLRTNPVFIYFKDGTWNITLCELDPSEYDCGKWSNEEGPMISSAEKMKQRELENSKN